jgi:hypothetical protein
MNLDHLFAAFARARELTGHTDYVVIGSLAVLGLADDASIPEDMSMSNDIDAYTKADPARIFDVVGALGAESEFHASNGYFVDPVSPHLPSLPDGWEARMNKIERDGVRVWFLEPNDAAVSKYARGEPRDQRWIRSGLLNGLVSLPVVTARLKTTTFLDTNEALAAQARAEADQAWFDGIKRGRRAAAKRPRRPRPSKPPTA